MGKNIDKKWVYIPSRRIQIQEAFDVAVVGGGVAGIAAALAAARNGAKVVLLEKNYLLGGLATSGLVCIYLPLCNGVGSQVSTGIAEELLKLSVSCGNEHPIPLDWMTRGKPDLQSNERYLVQFNPSMFAILCEQLLRREGVEIFYGTQVCDIEKNGCVIDKLFVQGAEGAFAILAKNIVDASGDAIVCRAAREEVAEFHQKNILASWYFEVNKETGNTLRILGASDIPDSEKDSSTVDNKKRYNISTTRDISRFMYDMHDSILADFLMQEPLSMQHSLGMLPTIPQLRMTWRLTGTFLLDEDHSGKHWEDSIGMIGNWKVRGPSYEIPYRALCCDHTRNLICAGRCIRVTDTMWDLTRVIPACAVTGQAAGTAASMGEDLRKPDLPVLQNKLTQAGVLLHI